MKRRQIYGLLLLAAFFLTGCFGIGGQETDAQREMVKIYYLNPPQTKMLPYDYEIPDVPEDWTYGEIDWRINCMMEQLKYVPQNLDRQAAIPEKVGYQGYKLEDTLLYLYFDSNYTMMSTTREVLCRASLVRTLCQLDQVEYVAFYAGDQPLMDRSGSTIGPMTASDFIDNISNVNVFEKTELTLYFVNNTGEKLVKETREVVHNMNTSLEQLVIEQLIAGPDRPGTNATLPKDTKLLNVTVNENVCYMNFDSSFLNNTLEVKEYIPIYSLVNSLAAVSSINKVQIAVNGSQDVMFRDSISLNQMFERNLDYNEEEENPVKSGGHP